MLVGPDLSVASFTLPFTVAAGSTVSVGDSVKNLGAATAGASVIRFYLSANATFDSGDTLLGERAVGSLGAGLTSSGTTSVSIPSGLSGSSLSLCDCGWDERRRGSFRDEQYVHPACANHRRVVSRARTGSDIKSRRSVDCTHI